MDGCFVEFRPKTRSLQRTSDCIARIAALKRQNQLTDESVAAELTATEHEYFWKPSPAEHAAWTAHWFATPLPQRHSPDMALPGWDFGSMVDAIAGAEFDIKGVVSAEAGHYLVFDPASYPFGGTGCLVALLECLDNEVVAVNDGTGLVEYVRPRRWTFQGLGCRHAGQERSSTSVRYSGRSERVATSARINIMDPLEVYERVAIEFPAVWPEDHSWVNVHDGQVVRIEELKGLLAANIRGHHAVVVVRSEPGIGAELSIDDVVSFIAPHVLRAEILVADPAFKSFVAVLISGVASGWNVRP